VVFKYEQKNPNAKVGLVLKKGVRVMPRYASIDRTCGGDFPSRLDPLVQEVMSCYCLWASTGKYKKWWVPVTNLTLVNRGAE
jgi:hypothetical protein